MVEAHGGRRAGSRPGSGGWRVGLAAPGDGAALRRHAPAARPEGPDRVAVGRRGRLRHELRRSEAGKERLKERLRRAVETARSRSPGATALDLRKALGRSLRQKAALRRLSKEHARLRRRVEAWGRRNEFQALEIARLRRRLGARGQRIEAQELEIARLRYRKILT